MKVADLIAELSKLPQDAEVYVWQPNYEGSLTDEFSISVDEENDVILEDGK